ncbi:unnamed protein product, partial [Heterotrigona itama]
IPIIAIAAEEKVRAAKRRVGKSDKKETVAQGRTKIINGDRARGREGTISLRKRKRRRKKEREDSEDQFGNIIDTYLLYPL